MNHCSKAHREKGRMLRTAGKEIRINTLNCLAWHIVLPFAVFSSGTPSHIFVMIFLFSVLLKFFLIGFGTYTESS